MAQGLATIAEYKKKQEEALKAAEGKDKPATAGLKAAAPAKPEPAKPTPAPVYVPQKEKTPEEKAKLAAEMKAEMEFRARKAAERAKK